MAIRRILVAVKDPRARSLPSVDKAVQLANAWGARIELFHALDSPIYLGPAGVAGDGPRGLARELRARSLGRLEIIAARIRESGVDATVAVEWDFPVYEAIVRRARHWQADLIVAECRPGRRLAPMLLRLTDWELLRLSPVPVLLVKDERPYRQPVVLAAIDPQHARAKPDGLDDVILRAGTELQAALRGTLHAVHAFAPLGPNNVAWDIASAQVAIGLQEEAREDAEAVFARALRRYGIPGTRRHLVGRTPHDAILGVARTIRSSIVVMGAVSRRGLSRLLIGNTAERLLAEIPCDVLVVKPRRFASRVPAARRGMRFIGPVTPSAFG